MAGIGWGLPPATPHVAASDLRCSYAFDEDDVLTPLSFTNPARGDLDPRDYHWGTFHFELVLPVLEAAEALGVFGGPWRQAYYNLVSPGFERVYIVARLVSVATALAGIIAVFLLGREAAGAGAGLWAALLLAVSPAHVLTSAQIRVDVTMATLVTLAAWCGLRGRMFSTGLAAGLAVTAKYSAVFMVTPMLLLAVWGRGRRAAGRAAASVVLGCLIGQPYLLVRSAEMIAKVEESVARYRETPQRFVPSRTELLARHGANLARFSLGVPAALLALYGLSRMMRDRKWLIPAAVAGGVASLVPLLWPLLRYQVPLAPLLAVAAAVGIGRRRTLGAAAAIVPLAASLAQVHYMRSPHPANQVLPVILRATPPGAPIARLTPEMPPLDRKVYPMGLNPLLDDLPRDPPAWVLITDLPDLPYPPGNLDLLAARYDQVAEFRSRRILAWATLGEAGAPHDWKYTHASMTLYRRR